MAELIGILCKDLQIQALLCLHFGAFVCAAVPCDTPSTPYCACVPMVLKMLTTACQFLCTLNHDPTASCCLELRVTPIHKALAALPHRTY